MNQFPTFDLLIEKEAGELVQMLTDHGLKFPKDNYYMRLITDQTLMSTIHIIGEYYIIRITNNLYFSVYLKKINTTIDMTKNQLGDKDLHNPIGPAWKDLRFSNVFVDQYYINGKEITKEKFVNYRTSQRIKLINE